MEPQGQHFLVVIYPGQGHINPGRSLAKRLAKVPGARVTFSTAISAHRQLFPSLESPNQEISDGPITYIPYSDGYDNGIKWFVDDINDITEKFNTFGPATLSSILGDLAARGQPVTCVVDNPSFVVNLPHLAPLKICDLPSFFTNFTNEVFNSILKMTKLTLESALRPGKIGDKSLVLINTFEELESEALKCIEEVEILPIGPDIPSLFENIKEKTESMGSDLFQTDSKNYMEWLSTKQNSSVVYVSFGSVSSMSKKQMEEMQCGLKASGHPYLWVVRKNNREEEVALDEGHDSMVVQWCNQVQVLSHPSIGCFVTHCGWNSTLESLAYGVPMVAVPQWTDQDTNARMVVEWGTGVRAEVNKEGVLKREVLESCLETVMGNGEHGIKIRQNAKVWEEKAKMAVRGGSSDHNFKDFLEKTTRV
ncbi:Glycosyltransferase [Rhynchospora pubera]|uniref:Glycosyltransferase n=1 Tax=Rhynchospora pubera TaxID=906938 RepID=A0AAV8FCA8_9POAL|nr:Glycosyltransferase [Rhynchospora pubera]